jgi:hypothetical protein
MTAEEDREREDARVYDRGIHCKKIGLRSFLEADLTTWY